MKAFLLAAGTGSRLRPLTNTIPKCLVTIAEKPLLAWWMDLFRTHNVSEVLINTHHLREQVRSFIDEYSAQYINPHIQEYYEEKLLGSGGTVYTNKDFVSGEENFLICYADNITGIDLTALIAFHKEHDGVLSMALSRTTTPEQAGITTTDSFGRVIEFEEKPLNPKHNLANAGVYVANNDIFQFFTRQEFIDFGKDVLPALIGHMYAVEINEYHLDIGTPSNLRKARDEWLIK